MDILCVLICSVCAFLGFAREKKIYSAAGIYSLWFALLAFFARFHFFDMYEISGMVYALIAMGVVCFSAGTGIVHCFRVGIRGRLLSSQVNDKILNLYLSAVTAMYVPVMIRTVKILLEGHNITYIYILANASNDGHINEMTATAVEELLKSYLFMPLFNLCVPVLLTLYYTRARTKYLLWSVILVAVRIVTSGTRNILLVFCEYFFFLMMMTKKRNKSKKIKVIFAVVIAGALSVIYILTRQRGIDKLAESVYFYYPGSLAIMDANLSLYADFRTYGFLSCMGFVNPVMSLLEHAGITAPEVFHTALNIFHSLQHCPVNIAPMHEANVFVTNIFYFYIDGGTGGVVLGSLIYGMVSERLFLKSEAERSEKNVSMFLFWLCMMILCSHIRMQTTLMYIALSWLYMIPLFIKVK